MIEKHTWWRTKSYKRSITKCIVIIFVLVISISSIYFSTSYGIFKKEQHFTNIDFITGDLKYSLSSENLNNNQISISSNAEIIFDVTISSLNEISSKYELYYLINGEKIINEDVFVGYTEESIDNVSDIIEVGEEKTVTIKIKNRSSETVNISFDVQGGFLYNTLVLTRGNKINLYPVCDYKKGHTWEFAYTGFEEEFDVPCNGYYTLYAKGADGGLSKFKTTDLSSGSKGDFLQGTVRLEKSSSLFVLVGGKGSTGGSGGYPDGGHSGKYKASYSGYSGELFPGSGGGSTSFRLNGITDDDRILVAGGGGGSGAILKNYLDTYNSKLILLFSDNQSTFMDDCSWLTSTSIYELQSSSNGFNARGEKQNTNQFSVSNTEYSGSDRRVWGAGGGGWHGAKIQGSSGIRPGMEWIDLETSYANPNGIENKGDLNVTLKPYEPALYSVNNILARSEDEDGYAKIILKDY